MRGDFYPRPPRGGRPLCDVADCLGHRISIHALREEGDASSETIQPVQANFYPRPPRGGRLKIWVVVSTPKLFLSTPSARRATFLVGLGTLGRFISIHALREEGDVDCRCEGGAIVVFLSTPSARRATQITTHDGVTATFLSTPSARRATIS